MAVATNKLPELKLGSTGKAVTWAKVGVNKQRGKSGNTTPIYGPFFTPLVKEFKRDTWCGDLGRTGIIGEPTWIALLRYIPASIQKSMPQVPLLPKLGPVYLGGSSILHEDLTHQTSGIPLYPAFDTAYSSLKSIIAPENLVISERISSSHPGAAFFASGESGIDYWFGHMDRRHALGTVFKKGGFLGHPIFTTIGGGSHLHLGINVERIMGAGKQLNHKTGYLHGAPTIGAQLLAYYSL